MKKEGYVKKIVFFITVIAILALFATTLYAEAQVIPQSTPIQKLNVSETIICPATIKVQIIAKTVPASGWPGFMPASLWQPAWITVPFKSTEIREDSLICWYEDNTFCSEINATTYGQKYGNCMFTIWQEKPGYICEKAHSNNGFVCRPK